MNDDDTYTDDDEPADDDSRSRGPWYRRDSDPGWDYDPGPDPALGVPHPDPRARDRAADAALDQWLNRRGL